MKRQSLWLPLLLLVGSYQSGTPAMAQSPRLAVVIAVDQMRSDYLDVFASNYDGGFARLREGGAIFADAHQDHAITETSPGHTSISTGVFPSRHGLVANEFFHRGENREVGAVADRSVALVGGDAGEGSSPFRMLRSSLSDWLKAADSVSKALSVSIKDRSAILMGGKSADAAYWLDLNSGQFLTSDYYLDALPEWVRTFNRSGALTQYNGSSWARSADDSVYDDLPWRELAGRDPAQYASLPRAIGAANEPIGRRYYLRLRGSPFADLETLNFARAMIESEELGEDDSPDLLFIGLSAADYIGHRIGPYSDEIHDQFLRLDDYLGEFLGYLDERMGAGNYVVVLSADHGAAPVPELAREIGLDAGRVDPDDLVEYIRPVVEQAFAAGELPSLPELDYASGLFFVFGDAIPAHDRLTRLQNRVAEHLLGHPAVSATYTHSALRDHAIDDPEFAELYARSFHPERAPDVTVRLRENYILRDAATGTSHGSPYRYDTHVPIIFYGAGVEGARLAERVRTVDIAPTLAALLGVPVPDDLDGRDLSSLLHSRED
ncbi:MAG TPA: alkaline phosphatase family protein [Gammaproteobacteria bacterium]